MSDTERLFLVEDSVLATWAYFTLYCLFFFATSIWSAMQVKDEYKINKEKSIRQHPTPSHTHINNTIELHSQSTFAFNKSGDNISVVHEPEPGAAPINDHNCCHYFKHWAWLTWEKRLIYIELIPHLFDQATDFGVVFQFYQYMQNDEDIREFVKNPAYFFYLSISILIFHRIVSSFGVWLLTRNWLNVLLQLFDILMIRSVWTSYKLHQDEPSTSQRYLGILEATFEAMPQLLLNTVFISKTGQFNTIIMISFVSSLWSLTERVSSDDRILFEDEWKYLDFSWCKSCPIINYRFLFRVFVRFLEISSRVSLLTLMWINLGGLATGIIIGLEMVYLIISCYSYRAIGNMGNLMYAVLDNGYADHLWTENWKFKFWQYFIFYRIISSYFYMFLVTIFAWIRFEAPKVDDYDKRHNNTAKVEGIGFYIFICCWVGLWPCFMYLLLKKGAMKDDRMEFLSTSRAFERMDENGDYIGILELIHFGKKCDKNEFNIMQKIGADNKREIDPDLKKKVDEAANKFRYVV